MVVENNTLFSTTILLLSFKIYNQKNKILYTEK